MALYHHVYRVCHIATELVKGLNEKHEAEPVKGPDGEHLDQPLIPPKDVLCVQIAALCHDLGEGNKISWVCMYCNASVTVADESQSICMHDFHKGHGPFSHLLHEKFLQENDSNPAVGETLETWRKVYSCTYSINSHMILVLRLMNHFYRMHACMTA